MIGGSTSPVAAVRSGRARYDAGGLRGVGVAIAAALSQLFILMTSSRALAPSFLWSASRGNRTRMSVFGPFTRGPSSHWVLFIRFFSFFLLLFPGSCFNERKRQSPVGLARNQLEVRAEGPRDPLCFSTSVDSQVICAKVLTELSTKLIDELAVSWVFT